MVLYSGIVVQSGPCLLQELPQWSNLV